MVELQKLNVDWLYNERFMNGRNTKGKNSKVRITH